MAARLINSDILKRPHLENSVNGFTSIRKISLKLGQIYTSKESKQ